MAPSRYCYRLVAAACVSLLLATSCSDATLVGLDQNEGTDDSDDDELHATHPDGTEFDYSQPEPLTSEPGVHMLPWIDFVGIPPQLEDEIVVDQQAKTVTLTGEAAELAEGAERGDIIYSPSHDELAVQVVEVSRQADRAVFDVQPLVLSNVVYGHWEYKVPIGEDDLESRDGELVRRGQPLGLSASRSMSSLGGATGSISMNVDRAALDIGVGSEFEFTGFIKVRALGHSAVEDGYGDHNCDDALIDNSSCTLIGCMHELKVCLNHLKTAVNLTVSPQFIATLKAEISSSAKFPSSPHTLYERNLPVIQLGTTPFTLMPRLVLTAQSKVTASAAGTLDVDIGGSYRAPLGVEYTQGSGFRVLDPLGDGVNNLRLSATPGIDASASVSANISASVNLSVGITGLADVVRFGDMAAGAKLEGKATYSPADGAQCLTADITLNPFASGDASVTLDGGIIGLGSYSHTFGKVQATFGQQTLYSWDGQGRFCVDRDELVELRNTYNELYDVDCSQPDINPFEGTCAEHFLQGCFNPEGQCQGKIHNDKSISMEWESGESSLTKEITGEGPPPTQGAPGDVRHQFEAFAPGGELCADAVHVSQVSSEDHQAECDVLSTFVLRQDAQEPAPGSDYVYQENDILRICLTPEGSMEVDCAGQDQFQLQLDAASGRGMICSTSTGQCDFELAQDNPGE